MKLQTKWLFLVGMMVFLASCSPHYKGVENNLPIALTINIKDMTMTFIDLEKEKVIHTWELEKPYTGGIILPSQDTIALFGKQVETVDVYSLESGQQLASWPTGSGLVAAKLLSNQQEIAFADQQRQSVRFFNLDGEETKEIKTPVNPLTMLESNSMPLLFVISYSSSTLSVIDLSQKEIQLEVPIHQSAAGAMLHEEEQEIWIGGHGEGVEIERDIHVYNWETGELKKTISAPVMPINLMDHEDLVYCLSHGSSTLYQLDLAGRVHNSIKIGANPFEMTSVNQELLVAGYDSNELYFVTTEPLAVRKSIRVGKGPFQILVRENNHETIN